MGQLTELSCLDVMMKAGIPDIVTSEKGGTSVATIAEKTGMNADKLVRVMRLLTAMDIFTEVKDRYFRLTSLGKQYQSTAVLHPMHMMQFPPFPVLVNA
jgi:predicted transcriptional regulator